jgi:predicted XRE-type DNA-binding protein/CheY-like chemotaxis protein
MLKRRKPPSALPLVQQVKESLAQQILGHLTKRGYNQTQAAEVLQTQQPRVSDLTQFHLDKFSIDMLVTWLQRLEQPIVIDTQSLVAYSSERKSIRILLIEDNDDDADLLYEALNATKGLVLEIIRANSLAEGATIFSAAPVDAILLDLGLPDHQGIETYKVARATLSTSIPIIILTGLADSSLPGELVGMGAENFLKKGDRNIGYVLGRTLFNAFSRRSDH